MYISTYPFALPISNTHPFALHISGHSDSDGNDSDIEDVIMAQLYFHDVQAKKSGMLCVMRSMIS